MPCPSHGFVWISPNLSQFIILFPSITSRLAIFIQFIIISPAFSLINSNFYGVPSGKQPHNYGKSPFLSIFNGTIHYNWPFSIAILTSPGRVSTAISTAIQGIAGTAGAKWFRGRFSIRTEPWSQGGAMEDLEMSWGLSCWINQSWMVDWFHMISYDFMEPLKICLMIFLGLADFGKPQFLDHPQQMGKIGSLFRGSPGNQLLSLLGYLPS